LSYWGTGNAGPWVADQRSGDNLYANSVVAIDVTSGVIESHHQYHWNDAWDWDEVSSPLLIDIERQGKKIKSLIHAGRNGYLWTLGRYGKEIGFVEAEPYVRQNVFRAAQLTTRTKLPGRASELIFAQVFGAEKIGRPKPTAPRPGYFIFRRMKTYVVL